MLSRRMFLSVLLSLAPVAAQTATPPTQGTPPSTSRGALPQSDTLTRARSLLDAFYAVRLEGVWSAFTPAVREEWGSLEQFRAYRVAGIETYGAEKEVLDEQVFAQGRLRYYVRNATFERQPDQVWSVVFAFDSAGRVAAFTIAFAGLRPPRPAGPTTRRGPTPMALSLSQ